jgi:thymidylate synthase
MYKSDDERQMAFPCLVHIDVSVVGNRISLMAVYRHWHLVHKAYGNLIGLTRLLHFLSQQTGYDPGELLIHATVANAEVRQFSHTVLRALIAEIQTQLMPDQEVI